jgi:zinc transporter 2
MEEKTGPSSETNKIYSEKINSEKLSSQDHKALSNLRKLYISIGICALFMTAEIIGGIISGSLAILTDAAHILSDILGFGISVISIHITRLPASRRMSFGFHRAEVLGALLSIAAIWALTAWLISEAIHRIIHLNHVDGEVMVITAIAGLAGNLIMVFVLGHNHNHIGHSHDHGHGHGHGHGHEHHDHHDHEHHEHEHDGHGHHILHEVHCDDHDHEAEHNHENLNMRAAVLHVIGDVLQSAGVIVAGCIIYFYPHCSIADPICTLLFSVIVMFTTIPIVKSCLSILMEATPETIDSFEIEQDLRNLELVSDVHDLHVWSISSGKISLSVHLIGEDGPCILQKAQKMLKKKYGILHTTIQIELSHEKDEFDCISDIHE